MAEIFVHFQSFQQSIFTVKTHKRKKVLYFVLINNNNNNDDDRE